MKIDNDSDSQIVTGCKCSKCGERELNVKIINAGMRHNSTFDESEYYFCGEGKCAKCGNEEWYSDSSL